MSFVSGEVIFITVIIQPYSIKTGTLVCRFPKKGFVLSDRVLIKNNSGLPSEIFWIFLPMKALL